jgi:hypothetical protein
MEPHLTEFRELAFKVEFLNKRYLPDGDETSLAGLLALFKSFEPYRKKASLFLNKGYSPKEEEACELLRNRLIKKYVGLIMRDQKVAFEKTFTLVWVYKMLCQDSCLNKKMSTEFVRAVEEEDHVLLLSCINHYTVMRNTIARSEFFKARIKKELCSIDDFLKIISEPFVPVSFMALMKEEEGDAFLPMRTDNSLPLFDLAKHYYNRAKQPQAKNENNK